MKFLPTIAMPAWLTGVKVISSNCGTCQKSWALRNLPSRKIGIRMHDNWYCGARCFTIAAQKEMSQLLTAGLEQANHTERMPLGLTLVSRGLLTTDQLKEITGEQKANGAEIGDLLVSRGIVSEKQVTALRAEQWGCPIFAVPKHGVGCTIFIPIMLMQRTSFVSLHYVASTNILLVGFIHSIEYGLLYAIERITGCKTQPCFVTPSDFQIQLEMLQQPSSPEDGDEAPKEVEVTTVETPAAMARRLCDACLDVQADEVVIGKCKEYLWASLRHEGAVTDLLFKTS